MDLLQALEGTPLAGLLPYAPLVVALCSLLDAAFPQPRRDSRWWPLRRVVSRLACNVGNARNASDRR